MIFGRPVTTFPDHASGDSGIETALELGEQLQDLTSANGCVMIVPVINPEVCVEQSGPGEAPRAASGRAGFGIDVERQSPFLGHAGEEVRVVRALRVHRLHVTTLRSPMWFCRISATVSGFSTSTVERAFVQQHLQKFRGVLNSAPPPMKNSGSCGISKSISLSEPSPCRLNIGATRAFCEELI